MIAPMKAKEEARPCETNCGQREALAPHVQNFQIVFLQDDASHP